MLADANLPIRYWAEAVFTAVYLLNRSPTKALRGVTPEEIWSGSKPNVAHLKVFGCETSTCSKGKSKKMGHEVQEMYISRLL